VKSTVHLGRMIGVEKSIEGFNDTSGKMEGGIRINNKKGL